MKTDSEYTNFDDWVCWDCEYKIVNLLIPIFKLFRGIK